MKLTRKLEVFLPDTRDVEISRFGFGNMKIGMGVYTYSRLAGAPQRPTVTETTLTRTGGTCPGATAACESFCYAKRIGGIVKAVYLGNSYRDDVPEIPAGCEFLRIHVSGDFDSPAYIRAWRDRLLERPDVTAWAYTRSWRVPALLPHLEELRALPNLQLFASMDGAAPGEDGVPPAGWRRAWISNIAARTQRAYDGAPSYVCPEETGHKPNCASCGYCFEGKRNDVIFLPH